MQAAKGVESSRDVYDDADFYALLLRELVEQRGAEVGRTGTQGAGGGGMGVEVPSQRDLKVRKQVDRKASKVSNLPPRNNILGSCRVIYHSRITD